MSISPSQSDYVDIPLNGTIGVAIGSALAVDLVRVALGAYIEGAGLEKREYRLEITAARLVPVSKPE